MSKIIASNQTILVVGGGVSGMTAAIEAAEVGKQVVLVEKRPFVGGRVTQLYKYFPKLCHPTCGLEINQRRMKMNPNVSLLTMAEVLDISGEAGDYSVRIRLNPRFVNDNCTACGACADVMESEFDNEFDYGLSKRKGAYLPFLNAFPQRYVLDPAIVGGEEGEKAKAACSYNAIDLQQEPEEIEFRAGAVIWATGWRPYDANKIQPYGYDRIQNVVTSVEFERMLDPSGPTNGKLVRPSDGKEAKRVAFIQCAGSRDQNHLAHCSRICCMASLKQATYVRDTYPDDGEVSIYYIDIRAIDRFEAFYQSVKADEKVSFIKSKVARIAEERESGDPILHGVDTQGYHRYANSHDLVVLAVGMEPSVNRDEFPVEVVVSERGFIEADESRSGVFAAGCASDALDVNRAVQSATASALRAVQIVNRNARAEVQQ